MSPVLLLILTLFLNTSPALANDRDEANRRTTLGAQLYAEGHIPEAFVELKAATEISPKTATFHMNYGSLLFDQARVYFYKEGHTKRTQDLAEEAKKELGKAINLFGKDEQFQASHVNYLMGDLYSYFYEKYDKAKEHYNAAIKINPKNRDAQSGLIRIGQIEASPESKKALTPVSEAAKKPSTLRTIVSPGKASGKELADKLTLTSGEVVDVRFVEETPQGVWVEMGEGANVFFSKSEYLKITKKAS